MSHAVVPRVLQSRLKKPSNRRWNINGSPLLKVRVALHPCDLSSSQSSYSAVQVFVHNPFLFVFGSMHQHTDIKALTLALKVIAVVYVG